MDENTINFKNELRDLLKKYNAEIWVELDGDTHGVSCNLIVDINNKQVMHFSNEISQYELLK